MPVTVISRHPHAVPAIQRHARSISALFTDRLAIGSKRVNIVLTDDREVRELNRTYRHKDRPTNVLSFPFTDNIDPAVQSLDLPELGDIVISVDRAEDEARLAGQTLQGRLCWLIAHGILHLVGYDHEISDAEAEKMSAMEEILLKELQSERSPAMIRLAINVDHVATIRQARGGAEPDPVAAASICELAGAEGIVVHLREDRRHIQDRDVRLLRQTVKTKLNLEMGATAEIIKIAVDIVPDMVTLVPEKRQELTTEGGLDVVSQKKKIGAAIKKLAKAGIPVSLFIDPDLSQIKAAADVGATFVELHTGAYADAPDEDSQQEEFELIRRAAEEAHLGGLRVNAGHGLNYVNTAAIATLDTIEELSIGHAIISRAVFSGLDKAVRDMRQIINNARFY